VVGCRTYLTGWVHQYPRKGIAPTGKGGGKPPFCLEVEEMPRQEKYAINSYITNPDLIKKFKELKEIQDKITKPDKKQQKD
jgi:hypothetical protein